MRTKRWARCAVNVILFWCEKVDLPHTTQVWLYLLQAALWYCCRKGLFTEFLTVEEITIVIACQWQSIISSLISVLSVPTSLSLLPVLFVPATVDECQFAGEVKTCVNATKDCFWIYHPQRQALREQQESKWRVTGLNVSLCVREGWTAEKWRVPSVSCCQKGCKTAPNRPHVRHTLSCSYRAEMSVSISSEVQFMTHSSQLSTRSVKILTTKSHLLTDCDQLTVYLTDWSVHRGNRVIVSLTDTLVNYDLSWSFSMYLLGVRFYFIRSRAKCGNLEIFCYSMQQINCDLKFN